MNLQLDNASVQEELLSLLSDIDWGFFSDDEQIMVEINQLLEKLTEEDQQKVIQKLHSEFQAHSFMQNEKFAIQSNLEKQIIKPLGMLSWKEFTQLLQNEKLCEEYQIPQFWTIESSRQALIKNPKFIPKLLEFKEINQNAKFNYLRTLEKLLDLYFEIQNSQDEDKVSLEQILGAVLQRQIIQFEQYHSFLKQLNQKTLPYQQKVENVQMVQLKIATSIYFEEPHFKLLSIQTIYFPDFNVHYYIKSLFKQSEQNFIISGITNLFQEEEDKLDEIYFTLSFYFQYKYCDHFNLSRDWKIFNDNLVKLFGRGIEQKQKQFQRQFKTLEENAKDETYKFFLKYIVCFRSNEAQTDQTIPFSSFQIHYYILDSMNAKQLIQEYSNYLMYKFKFCVNSCESYKLLLFISLEEDIGLEKLLEFIHTCEKQDIFYATNCIENQKIPEKRICYKLFTFLGMLKQYDSNHYFSLQQLFNAEGSFQKQSLIQQIFFLLQNQNTNQDNQIESILETNIQWSLIKQVFIEGDLEKIFLIMLQHYKEQVNKGESNQKQYYNLQKFSQLLAINYQLILKFMDKQDFDFIIVFETLTEVASENYQNFLNIILKMIDLYKMSLDVTKLLNHFSQLSNINNTFKAEDFASLLQKGFQKEQIQNVQMAKFYKTNNQFEELDQICFKLYQENPEIYNQSFREEQYFNRIQLNPEYFEILKDKQSFPENSEISLEDFNITIAEITKEDKIKMVQLWMKNMQNKEYFKQLIPLYFNVIKKKESAAPFLSLINSCKPTKEGYNMKAMFQILYNNSNHELQTILLKLWSEANPVPFMYKNFDVNEIKNKQNFQIINTKLMYIFPNCYPIINFSLSDNHSSYGKTNLINDIFYNQEVFEVSDNCKLNANTVDIMFDYKFSETRQFAVADVHGQISKKTLRQILPLFRFWIIQMNSEDEFEANFANLKKIFAKNKNLIIDFNLLHYQKCQNVEQQEIPVLKLQDLTEKELDKQTKICLIEQISQQLFEAIEKEYQKDKISNNFSNSKQFIHHLKEILGIQNKRILEKLQKENGILDDLDAQLEQIINQEVQGFLSQEAFPIRNLEWQISTKQEELKQSLKQGKVQKQNQLTQELEQLKQQFQKIRPTMLLQLFQNIFIQENFYIVYLLFAEKVRQLNARNTFKLQERNQKINDRLFHLKNEKRKIKNKNDYQAANYQQLESEIVGLKQELVENQNKLLLFNVSIELFWRDLISMKQKGVKCLKINPTVVISQLIKKGEPFEFLNGDSLTIDQSFLQELVSQFQERDNENVLVLSVLGAQSSGKSTILNKIFGCQFWTSVGRCTKGIYLQLIKVNQKSLFYDQIDYVLILDTEGLQSPNKNDQEFDKKIALFVLAVSDVILINVKGDINSQFKNLIEMCLYTLGEINSCISRVKQLCWCFNQNTECDNVQPFLEQIIEIVNKINLQLNQDPLKNSRLKQENHEENNQNEFLDILEIKKENAIVLERWKKDDSFKTFQDCKYRMFSKTFSEEAYIFGLKMMKAFAGKFKQEENKLPCLQQLISNICSNWESICRLPDLLEFTELVQCQQDQYCKNYRNGLFEQIEFSGFQKEVLREIDEENLTQLSKSQEFYDEMNIKYKNNIKMKFQEYLNSMEENLKIFKRENQISKKIFLKHLELAKKRLKTQEQYMYLKIIEEIAQLKTKFCSDKGFMQLEQFVLNLKTEEQIWLKENIKSRDEQFEFQWKSILEQAQKQKIEVFHAYCHANYTAISNSFSQYILKSEFHKQYIDLLVNEAQKQPTQEEQYNFFDQFQEELKNKQFIMAKNDMKYSKIFNQDIKIRFKKNTQKNEILGMNKFITCKWEMYINQSKNFLNYLKSASFFQDLEQHLKYDDIWETWKIKEFLRILKICSVSYDQQELHKFIQSFKGSNLNENQFQLLQQSFSLPYSKSKIILYNELSDNLKQRYPQLKLKSYFFKGDSNELENDISQFEKQEQEIQIVFVIKENYSINDEKYNLFQYILDQKKNQHLKENFESKFIDQFEQIMKSYWKLMYRQIYEFIQTEIVKQNRSDSADSCSEDENILEQNSYFLQIILNRIKKKIENFNEEFSKYGVILKDVGERCIYYYSIFIILRFSCYKEWDALKSQYQNFEKMKEVQKNKFIAQIEENKYQTSNWFALQLANNLKERFLKSFHNENQFLFHQQLNYKQIKSCAQLIQYLDQKYLSPQILEKNIIKKEAAVWSYISNQTQFISQFVNRKINKNIQRLKSSFQDKLRNEYRKFLENILINVGLIKQFAIISGKKSNEYFNYNHDELQNVDCENQLFYIVMNCLSGKSLENKNYNRIHKDYQKLFVNSDFVNIDLKNIQSLETGNQKIHYLQSYIDALSEQLNQMLKQVGNEILHSKFIIQNEINKMQFELNGCQEICPMCKRKCDQQNDDNHTHICSNGHFLRGMNGVLSGSRPSLFMCEEIEDGTEILTQESEVKMKWKDVKQSFQNWQFFQPITNIQKDKEKMMNAWNNGVGKLVCKNLQIPVEFEKNNYEKGQFDEKNHYIFLIDGSLKDEKWDQAKDSTLQVIEDIEGNQDARVSVIVFNDTVEKIFILEKPNEWAGYENIQRTVKGWKRIKEFFWKSAKNFEPAFQVIFELINNYEDFQKNIIIFFTDGKAKYPKAKLKRFEQLSDSIKLSTSFIFCSEENENIILVKTLKRLKKMKFCGELRSNVITQDLQRVWLEIVSESTHTLQSMR